jgi:hypothetical protein
MGQNIVQEYLNLLQKALTKLKNTLLNLEPWMQYMKRLKV